MKRTIFATLIFLTGITTFSFGQTEQGSVVIGADFPNFFNGLSRNGMKFNAGLFIADDFAVGASFGIRRGKLVDFDGDIFRGPAVDASLFVRYFIPGMEDDFRIFVQGEGGLDKTWANDLEERYEFVSLGGGFAYFLNNNLSLEASSRLRVSNQGGDLDFDLPRWAFGVRYYFGNREAL